MKILVRRVDKRKKGEKTMRFLKGLLTVVLVLIIIGGIGYLGYSYFYMDNMGNGNMANMPSNTTNNQDSTNSGMSGMSGNSGMSNNNSNSGMSGMEGMGNNQNQHTAGSSVNSLNIIAEQNRNQLNEAVTKINEAMDLITIDPYANATVPSNSMQNNQQQGTGSGTINIYPSGNSSLNIMPNGSTTTGTQPSPNMNNTPANNYVYDQGKLQQLHNGIFALAQGVSTLSDLNNDLLTQSSAYSSSLTDYQALMMQYYNALQNKSKLDNAISMINQATSLINVNPYASQNGYAFNADAMGQLNRGVYALAQGLASLNNLSQDFTKQMSDATTGVNYLSNGSSAMNMSNGMSSELLGNISTATIFNILLIIFVIGLFAGIIGAIFNLFRPRRNSREVT